MLSRLKLQVIIFLSAIPVFVAAQTPGKILTLDTYFNGIPLRLGYDEWVKYVAAHPSMGIDSSNDRGIYSSYKAGMKSHFPFPDSLLVKILLIKDRGKAWQQPAPYVDTTKGVAIEVVTGNNKEARKTAAAIFKQLRKELESYFEKRVFTNFGEASFYQGKTEQFPNVTLIKAYSKELHFYFVMIEYWDDRKDE